MNGLNVENEARHTFSRTEKDLKKQAVGMNYTGKASKKRSCLPIKVYLSEDLLCDRRIAPLFVVSY